MKLAAETRFDIGDTAFFLNINHEITAGIITRINCESIVYRDKLTGEHRTYTVIRYDLSTDSELVDNSQIEEDLYSTPDEILAMFNDQVQQGNF